ncbi:MAG: HEAT repeat domain-containing protein [Candidatus Muiribacteriota bacterium]
MENIEQLINSIDRGTESEREKAVKILFSINFDNRIFSSIKTHFNDVKNETRDLLFNLFVNWQAPETVGFLLELYSNSDIFTTKFKILNITAKLPVKNYTNALKNLLEAETSIELKIKLINLIGKTEDGRAFKFIESYMTHTDLDLRSAAFINSLNLNYRETLTFIIKIFSTNNKEHILNLLNLFSVINYKNLKFDISDFLFEQLELNRNNEEIYTGLLRTLLNFNNQKSIYILEKSLKEKIYYEKMVGLIPLLEKFQYSESVEHFIMYFAENPLPEIISELCHLIVFFGNKKESSDKFLNFLKYDNHSIKNAAVKIIINKNLLDETLDNTLMELIVKEENEEYFSDLFVALCSKNTLNNSKIVKLAGFFEKLPLSLKQTIIINFRKTPDNDYATNILYFIFTREENEKVRATIASVMGITATSKSLELFKNILKDDNPRVRANAIESIEMSCANSEEVVEVIFPFLQDFNNRVKANVAIALWQHGGLRMLHVLEGMLITHQSKWHRASAAYALSVLKNINSIPVLKKSIETEDDPDVLGNSIKALASIDNADPDYFINLYSNTDNFIRLRIIEALGILQSNQTLDFLFEKMISADDDIAEASFNALLNYKHIPFQILKNYIKETLNNRKKFEYMLNITEKTGTLEIADYLRLIKKKEISYSNMIKNTIFKLKKNNKE